MSHKFFFNFLDESDKNVAFKHGHLSHRATSDFLCDKWPVYRHRPRQVTCIGPDTHRHTDLGDLSHTKTSHNLSHLCRYTGHLSITTFCVYRENNSNRRNTSHVSVVAQLVAQVVTNCIYRTTYRTTCFVRSNRVMSVWCASRRLESEGGEGARPRFGFRVLK